MRPTPEEMAATVWRDNRYGDAETGSPNAAAQAYYAGHIFVVPIASASGIDHFLDMAGLRSASPVELPCETDPERAEALSASREVEVWLLGYEAVAAWAHPDGSVWVDIQAHEDLNEGYEVLGVPRPDQTRVDMWFLSEDGMPLAHVADSGVFGPIDVPGWPPR
jgi:hypothetical protein